MAFKRYGVLSNFRQFLSSLRGRGMKYIFHGAQDEWDALSAAEQDKYDQAEIEDEGTGGIYAVDKVEDGNMNAVTSNAVYDAIHTITSGTVTTTGLSAGSISWVKVGNLVRVAFSAVRFPNAGEYVADFNIGSGLPKPAEGAGMLQAIPALNELGSDNFTTFLVSITSDGALRRAGGANPVGVFYGSMLYIAAE